MSVSHVPLFIHDRTRQSGCCRDVKSSEERRLKKGGKDRGKTWITSQAGGVRIPTACWVKNTAVSSRFVPLFCLPGGYLKIKVCCPPLEGEAERDGSEASRSKCTRVAC